jgi:hypothetical protein
MYKRAPLFLSIGIAAIVVLTVAGIIWTRNNILKSEGSFDDALDANKAISSNYGYVSVSARETILEFYNAIEAENFDKAKALLDGYALEEFDSYCYSSSDAPVTSINIILTEEGTNKATVCVDEELTGFDSNTKMVQVTYYLELRGGVWKIVDILYREEEV